MQVLIVDDDEFALNVLETTLARMGYEAVAARDGGEAMKVLRRGDIRLVVTDWDMPGTNGVDLCRMVRREDLSGYVYLIMLTGREGAMQRLEGLCAGADDFLNKPLDPEELLVCLKAAERILSLETRDLALFALAKLAESRDSETGAHVERVQAYTRLIAQHLSAETRAHYGVDDEYIRLVYQTSPLHDLGKVAIPDAVLLKAGKLTPEEFAIMKTHTIVGAQTLDAALERFPNARFLQIAREIAVSHHEKFDGSGYPRGLSGEQIPLCGRIVAVADVYDALASRRVYKEAMTHAQARDIIVGERGNHFDPEVVDAFLRAEEQVVAVRERLRDDREPRPSPAALALPSPPQPGGPAPCKVLVVEDDPVSRRMLTQLIAATGEKVFAAANGLEALRIWGEQSPRVIVSDWEMPEADGVELCRRIRAQAGADQPHFIMLTGHSEKSRLLSAYQAGVDDFLSKPFDPEELLARLRAGIRAAKLHDECAAKAVRSQEINAQLATVNSRLEKLSMTDELTGLFNRRHAMLRLEEQWELAERHERPLSIAMIDIDHFKRINDTHGHDAGDAVLRRVAAILRDQTRGTDAVCRVGGEEFLIVFPAQTLGEIRVCAEWCRAAVESHPFTVAGKTIAVTISMGLATYSPGMTQCPDLLRAADEALYAAKHAGRNAVRVADPPQETSAVIDLPRAHVQTPAASDLAPPPVDLEAVLKRCGGDPIFAAAVVERFRTQAGGEVRHIADALARSDADGLRRAAHNLKSMAAYLSADAASDLARQIEDLGRANRLAEVSPLLARLWDEVEHATAWIARHRGGDAAQCA